MPAVQANAWAAVRRRQGEGVARHGGHRRSPDRARHRSTQPRRRGPAMARADLRRRARGCDGASALARRRRRLAGAWTASSSRAQRCTPRPACGRASSALLLVAAGRRCSPALAGARGALGWRRRAPDDATGARRRCALVVALACFVYALVLVGHGLPFWLGTALFVAAFVFVLRRAERRAARAASAARDALLALACGVDHRPSSSRSCSSSLPRPAALGPPRCSTASSRSAIRWRSFIDPLSIGLMRCCRRWSA